MGRTNKFMNVGKLGGKVDILIVLEKETWYRNNKKKRRLKMNPRKIELEARQLKAENMRTKKNTENENYLL